MLASEGKELSHELVGFPEESGIFQEDAQKILIVSAEFLMILDTVQVKKHGSHVRTSYNDENITDGEKSAIATGSMVQHKDSPLTLLIFKCPDGRLKYLRHLFLLVQGSEQSHLGSRTQADIDGLLSVPPPVIFFEVELQQQQQMIHPSESTGFANLYDTGSYAGEKSLRHSRLRNKRSKSMKSYLSEWPQSCNQPNISSDLLSSSSSVAISEVLDDGSSILGKPIKRNPRKNGKKKGRKSKRSSHEKEYPEDIRCDEILVSKTPICNPSCSSTDITENKSSLAVTLSGSFLQVSKGTDSSRAPTLYTLISKEMDEHEHLPTASSLEEYVADVYNCNQTGSVDSSYDQTCSLKHVQTQGLAFASLDESTHSYSNKSSSSCDTSSSYYSSQENAPVSDSFTGESNSDVSIICGANDVKAKSYSQHEHQSIFGSPLNKDTMYSRMSTLIHKNIEIADDCSTSHTQQKKISDIDNAKGRAQCLEETHTNNIRQTSVSVKRGRHGRQLQECSNAVNKFGSMNTHSKAGKDVSHSVWQRVQKKDAEGSLHKLNMSSLASSKTDSYEDLEMRANNDTFCSSQLNGNGKSSKYFCLDGNAVEPDDLVSDCSFYDSNKLEYKHSADKVINNINEKLKSKSDSVLKQGANQNSRRGSRNAQSSTSRPPKVFVHQGEAAEKPVVVNCYKHKTSDLRSSRHDQLKTNASLNGKTDFQSSQLLEEKQIHSDEIPDLGHIYFPFHDEITKYSQNQFSPILRATNSLEHKCMPEMQSVRGNGMLYKNACHSSANNAVGVAIPDTKGFHVENGKQDRCSGTSVQKWIPVGKKDTDVLCANHLHNLSAYDRQTLATDKINCRRFDIDEQGLKHHPFLCTIDNEDVCSSSTSESAICSDTEENGGKKLMCDHLLHLSSKGATIPATSSCSLIQETTEIATDLERILQVVADAYRLQLDSEFLQLRTGCPIAEFERVLFSVSPVIAHMDSLPGCKSCPQEKLIGSSLCQHQIPNISLGKVWQWYETPGSYGLEVKVDNHNTKKLGPARSRFRAYFVPYLSAIQLFGLPKFSASVSKVNANDKEKTSSKAEKALKSVSRLGTLPIFSILLPQPHKHMRPVVPNCTPSPVKDELHKSHRQGQGGEELLFEYFETDPPQQRQPLFEKIKELARGVTFSNSQLFGDPSKLESLHLHDIHPASWFSVAWYPIYRIPDGNFCAAFLTYHSLGNFIERSTESKSGSGIAHVVCPVSGLRSYNTKGECWFQLTDASYEAEAPTVNPSEILKERLRTLEETASLMARASVLKSGQRSVNRQPDYEFFVSRRW